MMFTTNPSLLEVFWYPVLRVLYNRSFKRRTDEADVKSLWNAWADWHLPWRLRRKLDRAYDMLRQSRVDRRKLRGLVDWKDEQLGLLRTKVAELEQKGEAL